MGVTYLQQIAITIFLILLSIVKINFAQLVSDADIIANINGRSDALPSLSNFITQDNDNLSAGGNIVASINGLSSTDTSLLKSSIVSDGKNKKKTHAAATGNIVARIDGNNKKKKLDENNKKGVVSYKSVGHPKKVEHKRKEKKHKKDKKDKKDNKAKHHKASVTSTNVGLSSMSTSNGSPGSLTLQLDIAKLEKDGLSTTDSQISLKNDKPQSFSSWSSSASSNAPVGTSSTTGSSTKKEIEHLSSISSLPSNLTLTNELKDSSLSMSTTSSFSRDQAIFLTKSSTPTLINNVKTRNGHYPKLQKVHQKINAFRSIDKAVNSHSKHLNVIHIEVPITKHKPINIIGVKNNNNPANGEVKLFGHIIKLPAITMHDNIISKKIVNSSFFSMPKWNNFADGIHPAVLSPELSSGTHQNLKKKSKKIGKKHHQNTTTIIQMNSSFHANTPPASALYISRIYRPKELLPNGVIAEENNFFALNDLTLPGTNTIPTPVNIGNTKAIKSELKKLQRKLLKDKKLSKIISGSSQRFLNDFPTMAAIKNSTSIVKKPTQKFLKFIHTKKSKKPDAKTVHSVRKQSTATKQPEKKNGENRNSVKPLNSAKKPTVKLTVANKARKSPTVKIHSTKTHSTKTNRSKSINANQKVDITVPVIDKKLTANKNTTNVQIPIEDKTSLVNKTNTNILPKVIKNSLMKRKLPTAPKLSKRNHRKHHHQNKNKVKALKLAAAASSSSSSSTPTLLLADKKALNIPTKLSNKIQQKHHHNKNIVKALKKISSSSSTPTLVLGTSSTLGFPISYDLISTIAASEKTKNDTSFMKLNGIPAFIEQDNLSQGSASGNIRGSIDSTTITVSNAGIHISISSGVINCDGFVCPPTSYKCAVIEKSGRIPHWHSSYSTLSLSDTVRLNDKIITTRSCSDSMGNVITSQTTYNLNPNPYHVVKTYSSANKKGFIKQCGNCLTSAEAHTPRPDRKSRKKKHRRREEIPYSSLTPLPTTTSYTSSASSSSPTESSASSSSSTTYTQPIPYTSTGSFTAPPLPSQYLSNIPARPPTKSVNTVYDTPNTNSFWQENMGGDSNTFV